jgi:hypothetical protein
MAVQQVSVSATQPSVTDDVHIMLGLIKPSPTSKLILNVKCLYDSKNSGNTAVEI